MFLAILASLQLLFMGYIPAAILGIPIGILIGINGIVYQIAKQIFSIPGTIPSIALLPIALATFQNSQTAAQFVIFFSAIWPMIINTATGVQQFRKERKNLGVGNIFTGLKVGMEMAWFAAIAVEMLTGSQGMGFSLWDAYNSNSLNNMSASLIYIRIVGFLLEQLLDLAGYALAQRFPEEDKQD